MKKILVLNHDYQVPQSALDYAIRIARHDGATIVGLFVQRLKKRDEEGYFFSNDIHPADTAFTKTTDEEENLHLEDTAIQLFSDTCTAAGVLLKTHSIHSNFLEALIDHSAFADLIICDADTPPALYAVKTLLAHAHCPVLMVNKDCKQTDAIVFTYDDKSSSIHAVKLFTYLFGLYRDLPVHFVSVVPHNVLGIEYEDLIREWLPLYYPNAAIEILKGETKQELPRFINSLSNPLVVMGAFGRSSLSRFFKESLANVILEQTNAPVFIAHD